MRKNFLNAILFGGLIALSAGSFVACTDYDDDIDGLQKQIDSVNTTLAALQTQVNAGRWVTTLTSIDGGFTVVFSDGSTYDIKNGQDGATGATGATGAAGSVLTVGEDGYWYIDGQQTDYKAAIDYSKTSYVKDGVWNIGGEQTTYKALGNTYAIKDAKGVWTLYVPSEDGTKIQDVELPTAAAMVTSIKVIDAKGYDKYLSLDNTTFTYSGSTNWDGATLPENGSRIMASNNKVLLQITPAEAAAGIKKITLVNSKGEALGFDLAANAYTGLLTRAAIANGLYELSIPAQAVDDEKYEALKEALKGEGDGSAMFGFAVDGVLRSDYDFATAKDGSDGKEGGNSLGTKKTEVSYYDASTGADSDKNALYIKPLSGDAKIALGSSEASSIGTAKTGEAITIGFSNSYIYDAYLTFDDATKAAFGITYDKTSDHQTFTVGKIPDEGSLTVKFTLTTVDVLGNVKTTALSTAVAVEGNDVTIKDEDSSAVDLSEDTPQIVIALEKNGINTTFWKNHCATVELLGLYSDAACTKAATDKAKATAYFSTADKKEVESAKEATHITVNIDKSGIRKMSGDYYLKLVSKSSDGIELGAIVVPVQLEADPTNGVKSLIADNLKGDYPETDGVIVISSGGNIENKDFDGSGTNLFGVNLTNYISGLAAIERGSGTGDNIASSCSVKIGDTAVTFALDGEDKSVAMINGKTAATSDVACFYTNPKGGYPWLLLKNEWVASDGKSMPYATSKPGYIQAGYGKDLIIKATTEDGESYSFKVRIESPIASGMLKVKDAGASFMDGAYVGAVSFNKDTLESGGTVKIYSDQIKLFAVNDSNPWDVFQHGVALYESYEFANKNIESVSFEGSDINRIKAGNVVPIEESMTSGDSTLGYVEFSKSGGYSSSNEDDWFHVTINDKFGYTRIWKVQTIIKTPRKAPTD